MVRKIPAKLVLGLRAQGLSARAIAAGHGVSRNSIAAVFEAVDRAHIKWDDLAEMSEAEVYQVVFPHRGPTRACMPSLIGTQCTKSSPESE